MNRKLKDFLTHDYRSYNAVQATSLILGGTIIDTWPNLNVWPFWTALAAYLLATVVSVALYTRHETSDTPVRAGFMGAAIILLVLIASARRTDWWTWTGFSILLPLAATVLASGFLYTALLNFARLHIYPRHKPLPRK